MPSCQMNRRECLFVMSRKKLSLDYSITRLHFSPVLGEEFDHVVGNRVAPGVPLSAALVLQFTLATRTTTTTKASSLSAVWEATTWAKTFQWLVTV